MLVVPMHSTTQNVYRKAVDGSTALLEFVDSAWRGFERSKGSAMRDLVVPSDIEHITVDGQVFTPSENRRIVWFELTGKMKNRNIYSDERFYLSQVTDQDGQAFQLHLDRSMCGSHEDLRIIRAKPLLPMKFSARANRLANGHAHT